MTVLSRMLSLCLLAFSGHCLWGGVVWHDDFTDRNRWPVCEDYDGSVRISFGRRSADGSPALCVTGTATGRCDTAWRVRSERVVLPRRSPKFGLRFTESAVNLRRELVTANYRWTTMLVWYGPDGRETGRRLFASGIRPGTWDVSLVDVLPQTAAAFELQLGFDGPDMPAGTEVRFADVSFALLGEDAVCGFSGADATPPRVCLTSASPTTDPFTPVGFSVSDGTGVAWERTKVRIDGKDVTSLFRRAGDGFVMDRPAAPWKAGLHRLFVHIEDVLGNACEARKVFYVGSPVKTPKISLRDDGVTLVDGVPFFPVGIYNVKRHEANGRDFYRAFADLGKAGFNFANSYRESRDPDFAAAARKHGFRLFEDAQRIRSDILDVRRHDPTYLVWYIGDDTADHNTPQMIRDRDENLRAVDGTRLTCQADYIEAPVIKDRYAPYVGLTDIFMPELYPVHGDHDASGCVARVVREMGMIRRNHRSCVSARTCAIWPIIQNFKGWTAWKRYPTPEETTAMSFAALVHGAKGILWYTYSSTIPPNPSKGRFDAGIADDPKAWNTATNLARRISGLSQVLMSPGDTAARVTVTDGPEKDMFGNVSVSGLVKRHEGKTFLIAVNAVRHPVRAKFTLPDKCSGVTVLWENRQVPCQGNAFEDDFASFGVHVYVWDQRD